MSSDQPILPVPQIWPARIRALRYRHFRVLWIGLVVSAIGTWMQIVAISLLVLKLTHGSALALGCVSLAQASAFFLFALVGGSLADRVDRRRLLLLTQSGLMVLAGALWWLTARGVINVVMIGCIAFLSGVILSFDQPARAALISTLVPKEDLLNAISLQMAVFNAAAIAGPALAGLAVNWMGLPANFLLNAVSYLGVLLALLSLPVPAAAAVDSEALRQRILGALAIVRRDSVVLPLVCVYGVLLLAGPSLPLLVPVLAADRLHVGAGVLGLLFSAAGLGSAAGAIAFGGLTAVKMWVVRWAVVFWAAALALTGVSDSVPFTFGMLFVLGASQSVVGAATSTLMQTRVAPGQRGRVMSLNTLLIMGVRPLGDFPMGAAIAFYGAPVAAVAGALVVAITGVAVLWRTRVEN